MTRAKRIEEAARALVELADWDLLGLSTAEAGLLSALEAALALPEEESEVGWIVRPAGDKRLWWFMDRLPYQSREDAERDFPLTTAAGSAHVLRVRITVEGEESER